MPAHTSGLVPIFYDTCAFLMRAAMTILTRWKVEGLENVPLEGPLILVANHLWFGDPPLLGASIPRRIAFMAKQEIYWSPLGHPFIRAFGAFPVRRGQADRKALRTATELVRQGIAVGMFPEGTRSRTGSMQQAHVGAAFVALHTGAPLLPVGITGTEKMKHIGTKTIWPRISVRIGQPFTLPPSPHPWRGSQRLNLLTDFIMNRIAELLPPAYRGVYGGTDPILLPKATHWKIAPGKGT